MNEQALEHSMGLFWLKGYFNASINELVKVSGLSRAAIYKQFGGKEGFFLAMLERYRQNLTTKFLAPLRNQEQNITAIFAFFEQFIDLSEQGQLQNGCFFINTASELPCHQNATKTIIDSFLAELKALLYQTLERGKAQNQLNHKLDSQACSSFLVANVFGLFTLARATNNSQLMREQVTMIKAFLNAYKVIP